MAWTGNKEEFCVLEFAKTESVVTVHQRFRTAYHTEPTTDNTIHEWYMKSQQSGCLCAAKRIGWPCMAGAWLQDWHLPRHKRWIYRAPVKVGQKLGVSLPLLKCSSSAWPCRLLYRRGQKSRRDLRITLYSYVLIFKWWCVSYAISYLYFI